MWGFGGMGMENIVVKKCGIGYDDGIMEAGASDYTFQRMTKDKKHGKIVLFGIILPLDFLH